MSAVFIPPGPPPGLPPHEPAVEEAGAVTHRELVGTIRAFGNHLLAMADLVEAEPFNDAAMMAADARFGELHACMRTRSAKFMEARFCAGGIQ